MLFTIDDRKEKAEGPSVRVQHASKQRKEAKQRRKRDEEKLRGGRR